MIKRSLIIFFSIFIIFVSESNSSENEIANYVFKDNQSIDQASRDLLINGITSADELIRVGNLKEDADI